MSITSELERIIDKRDVIREELQKVGLVDVDSVTIDEIAEDIPKNMVIHGAVSVEVLEGSTYTIPAGFHNGGGTVTAVTDVEGDISKRYKRQTKTVTPTKSQQGVGPDDGYYALESVIVNPIPDKYKDVSSANVTAPDVLTGVKFVGANGLDAGTMANNGAVSKTIDTSTTSYTIPAGYHNGSGKVSVTTETKSATPTKGTQNITPTSGKVLSKVTVNPIPAAYQDVTGVTTTADKVLERSKFVDADGNVVEGTMYNWGEWTGVGPNGEVLDKAVGSIDLHPGGKRSYEVPEGYHPAGLTTVTAASTVVVATPTKQDQTVVGYFADDPSEGRIFLDSVLVKAIPAAYQDVTKVTATAGGVLEGSKFVNASGTVVEGTMPNIGPLDEKLTASRTSYIIPEGYHDGSGIVRVSTETKTATPTKGTQNITPTSGKVLSKVTVNPIPDAYQDVTQVTATAEMVLKYALFVNKTGALVEGTMPNNGPIEETIDGLTSTSATIPAGYTSGGTVSLTNDIENALKAI